MATHLHCEHQQHDRRVIAYFDVDCFYAQAEILRRPYLKERPVGVTQKFLVVTCNYVARCLGVPKMASIDEAKRRCPDIVLINGEDLTPYRAASKTIMQVLGRSGTLERRGLDEAALDITEEVGKRVMSSTNINTFIGYLVGSWTRKTSDVLSSFGAGSEGSETEGKVKISQSDEGSNNGCLSMHPKASAPAGPLCSQGDFFLMVGSHVVAEIRAAIEKETGYCCSSGIAHNKLLAKLACSLNKPNKQTSIISSIVDDFIRPLPVRKISGVGQQMEETLKEMGIGTVEDLQRITLHQLCGKFGCRVGKFLYNACRGIDLSPVVDKGHVKSLSVEDSVRNCTSLPPAKDIMQSLAPDLLARLDEDKLETGRRPKVFTVKWRLQGSWNFSSSSTPMPLDILSTSFSNERREELVVRTGMQLLTRGLGGVAFSLVVLNIGATKFTSDGIGSSGASCDIRSFLPNPLKQTIAIKNISSKHEERLSREGKEKLTSQGLDRDAAYKHKKVSHQLSAPSKSAASCWDFEEASDCSTSGSDGDDGTTYSYTKTTLCHLQQESHPRNPCQWTSYMHSDSSPQRVKSIQKEINYVKSVNFNILEGKISLESRLEHSEVDEQKKCLDRLEITNLYSYVEEHKQVDDQLTDAANLQSLSSCTEDIDMYVRQSQLLSRSLPSPSITCERCGKLVTDWLRQEHADYHLAMDLQMQENRVISSQGDVRRSKNCKNQRGSLDSFVYKLQKE